MRQIYITVKEIKKLQKLFYNQTLQQATGLSHFKFFKLLKNENAILTKEQSDSLIEFLKKHNLQYIENEDTVIRDI